MWLYFRDLGIKLLEEIWKYKELSNWENLRENTNYNLGFMYSLSSSHCYHLKPWKMNLSDGRSINIGILQSNFDISSLVRKDGKIEIKETRLWEKIKNIPVLDSKNTYRSAPISIKFLLNPLLESGNALEFADMILPMFKKEVENHVREDFSWKLVRKFAHLRDYLIFWIPSKEKAEYDRKGNYYERNFITKINFIIEKKGDNIWATMYCWRRKEKFLKIIPEEYKNNPIYFRNIGNTRFTQCW